VFDRILMVLEILLLVVVVWQGEWVRYYERRVFEMNAERYTERAEWRKQKRSQQLKRETEPKINDFKLSTESLSPSEMPTPPIKTNSAKSVAVPLTPTDTPA